MKIYFNCCSKFGDIFDEEFFIYALKHRVNIVRELPEDVLQRFDHNISTIVNLRVKGWSSPTYYLHKVLPKLLELGYASIPYIRTRILVKYIIHLEYRLVSSK